MSRQGWKTLSAQKTLQAGEMLIDIKSRGLWSSLANSLHPWQDSGIYLAFPY